MDGTILRIKLYLILNLCLVYYKAKQSFHLLKKNHIKNNVQRHQLYRKYRLIKKLNIQRHLVNKLTLKNAILVTQFRHIKGYQNQSKQILKQTLNSKQYYETDFGQIQFKPFRRISEGVFFQRDRKRQFQEKEDKVYNIKSHNIKQQQLKKSKQKSAEKLLSLNKLSKSKSLTPITQFVSPFALNDRSNHIQKFQSLNKEQKKKEQKYNNGLNLKSKNKLKLIRNQSKQLISSTIFENQKHKILEGGTTFNFNLNKLNKQSYSQKQINNKHLISKLLINSKKSNQERNFNKLNLKLKKNRILTEPLQLPQFNDTIIYEHVFDVDNNFKNFKALTNKNILSLSQKNPLK